MKEARAAIAAHTAALAEEGLYDLLEECRAYLWLVGEKEANARYAFVLSDRVAAMLAAAPGRSEPT